MIALAGFAKSAATDWAAGPIVKRRGLDAPALPGKRQPRCNRPTGFGFDLIPADRSAERDQSDRHLSAVTIADNDTAGVNLSGSGIDFGYDSAADPRLASDIVENFEFVGENFSAAKAQQQS